MSWRCAGHGRWGCYRANEQLQRLCASGSLILIRLIHVAVRLSRPLFTIIVLVPESDDRFSSFFSFSSIFRFFTAFNKLWLVRGVFRCILCQRRTVGDLVGIGIPIVLHYVFSLDLIIS